MPAKEGLIACSACKHQFGRWRMRCPACGTSNDQRQSLAEAVDSFMAKDRPTDARVKPAVQREKPRRADECIFCRRGKSDTTCPECAEPIHKRCMSIHTPSCAEFQRTLRDAQQNSSKTERAVAPAPPKPSHLENTSGLADAINRSLKGDK